MRGRDILDLPLHAFGKAALRRFAEHREIYLPHQAAEDLVPRSIRDQMERAILGIVNEIDLLPAKAKAEAQAELKVIQKRVMDEVFAAFERPITDATIRKVQDVWTQELRRFGDEIARRHLILQREATRLGQSMADVPSKMLDLDVAPPTIIERDPRGFYLPLMEEFAEPVRKQLGDILEKAQQQEAGPRARVIRQIGKLIAPDENAPSGYSARAEGIFRDEVGREAQESGQARLEEVNERIQGLAKEWLSILSPSRTRPGHFEAHGQIVGVGEFYLVRGQLGKPFERLMHPKDPRGSVGNVRNCLCSSSPSVEAVSLRPSAF